MKRGRNSHNNWHWFYKSSKFVTLNWPSKEVTLKRGSADFTILFCRVTHGNSYGLFLHLLHIFKTTTPSFRCVLLPLHRRTEKLWASYSWRVRLCSAKQSPLPLRAIRWLVVLLGYSWLWRKHQMGTNAFCFSARSFVSIFVITFNFAFLYTQERTTTTIWLEKKITSRLYLTLRLTLNKWVYPTSTFSMTPGGTTVPLSSVMEDALSGKQCPQYSQTEWRKFYKK